MKIRIENQFNGPNHSGNGGYVCGMIDFHAPFTTSEVTLKAPPPLDKDLFMDYQPEQACLMDDSQMIGYARPGQIVMSIPSPPTFKAARKAAQQYIGYNGDHFFPCCFVCGPQRKIGDGLRIFPGRIGASDVVAAPWIPDAYLGDENGVVNKQFIWSALDCPGAFALMGDKMLPMVLGRMTCQFSPYADLQIGEKCVVMGWSISKEGRKLKCGTAVYNEKQELVAFAKATWITIDLSAFEGNAHQN